MLKMKLTLATVIATLATACAIKQDPTDTYAQGWRRAQILEVGKDQLVVHSDKQDCRKALTANAGYTKFAVATYSYGGNPSLKDKRIVAVPNEVEVGVGEWVFVNVSDCKLALRKVGLRNERP
ncbi:MAG: hypothetical protein HY836_12805 [Aquabacterium sp.]|uniref:hypothetical protein n=1 Tax=Aquabacterium sp. TaxID=1872578 RepID=UPI0025BA5E3F|nr:hypothetical protein [Aquabacterium sp.]MBI5926462.1 hypothetical protein [Aquabacterium sp.]